MTTKKMTKEEDDISSEDKTLFKNVIAFLDIKLDDNTNAMQSMQKRLESLGGKVRKTFSSKDITHIIYKNGTKKNFEKYEESKIALVNPLWVDKCIKSGKKLDENSDEFKAEFEEKEKSNFLNLTFRT
jgi:hypothetical protein